MSPAIILLETSTSLCSVALMEGDVVTAVRHSSEPRAHAAMTAPFVKEVLDERGLKVSDCDAVCLSMGPGSYTGLRVGSSTAKGLCFGGGIPLLAVSTLDVLVAQAVAAGLPDGCRYIVPMIDARRMEVYTAVYTADGQRLTEIAPVVVDGAEALFGATLCGTVFIGDGVAKCEPVLAGEGRWFRQECPTAEAMLQPALREWQAGNYRDTAYFEPFYLKDFIATTPKKLF
ncbi:MAG: tRNA (adenosine(37)-N6)-threonylcarbamoyltransferase complex dimerization subunit type 1 TsaB [Bacteroidales bacterium]|nr:tRNA (adenosine(37)-N6)-threonylcarbamoyltransferase complex dimerization subunit type 1 TsaB [Bacteroidales bacterium]